MKKFVLGFLIFTLLALALFGLGRLYYHFTAGFAVSNITSDFAYRPDWETRPLSPSEKEELFTALDQPYDYLGKGFQSYVFASQDGKYVIKFFKYQAYRLPLWVAYAPPLPAIVKYREEKLKSKWSKFEGFARSWKIAFENLKEETGLVYVHLNKTDHLNTNVTLFDKIGQKHLIDLDAMEFCVQRRAELLCTTLLNDKAMNNFEGAKQLISQLIRMLSSEHARGLTDNDPALMQNTGVAQGKPVHIDVGEFAINEEMKQSAISRQELLRKTNQFKIWLQDNYPELSPHLQKELDQTFKS